MITTPDKVRSFALLVALQHDEASEGSRAALASLIDSISVEISDQYLRWYLAGLADQLRRYSPARGSRPTEIN